METGERKARRQSEQARQVVRMYRDGIPTKKIREELHISDERLFKIIKDSGIPMRGRGRYVLETDPEKLRKAVEMYVAGEYISTIKRNLHIAERTLYRALKAEGVPRRVLRGIKKEKRRYGNKHFKQTKRTKQTTTNIVMLQKSYGEDFAGLAKRVLAGELAFRI